MNCIATMLVPSAAPFGITAAVVDSRTLSLNWQPPPEESRNGIILFYTLDFLVAETGDRFQATSESASYSAEELHPFYTYTYAIAAHTAVGIGPSSMAAQIRLPEDGRLLINILKGS